jgi:hypothetical protein
MYKCGKLYVIMMGSLNIHMRYKCTQVLKLWLTDLIGWKGIRSTKNQS